MTKGPRYERLDPGTEGQVFDRRNAGRNGHIGASRGGFVFYEQMPGLMGFGEGGVCVSVCDPFRTCLLQVLDIDATLSRGK